MVRGLYTGGEDDWVYFEKQAASGRYCGLHCLNNLLQSPSITKEQMNAVGASMDAMERGLGGANDNYQHASGDGFYSLDVLQGVLLMNNWEMRHFRTPEFSRLHRDAAAESDGFILNLREHWFAIRPVKGRWFSLDSLRGPEPISETMINGFVTSLESRDWTVFVVRNKDRKTRLPEPNPSRFPHIPKISTINTSNEYPATGAFLSFNAASSLNDTMGGSAGLGGGSGGGPAVSGPATTHQWPSGGGNTIGGGMATSSPSFTTPDLGADQDDPEILAVLRESVQEFKASIKPPPPEPASGGTMIKVQDSFGATSTRRFPPGADVMDLFHWLFRDDKIWSSQVVALGSMQEITLTAQFPKRELVCQKGDRAYLDGSDVTKTEIETLFPHMESFKLTNAQ